MSGDTKRTVSTAPPPRREVEVNLDTDAATDERPETSPSRPLDLGGFSDPGATDGPVGVAERSTDRQSTTTTPRKSTRRRARKPAAAAARDVSTGVKSKTTVQIPNYLVDSVRSWTTTTGRTNADAVLTAYLNQMEPVRERFAATAEDEGRAELGLPPIASTGPSSNDAAEQRRVQVGLFIQAGALEKLDTSAEELSMTRSQLVTELLILEYRGQSS